MNIVNISCMYFGGNKCLCERILCTFDQLCLICFLVICECSPLLLKFIYSLCGDGVSSMLDTVGISGEEVCCSVVFGALVRDVDVCYDLSSMIIVL